MASIPKKPESAKALNTEVFGADMWFGNVIGPSPWTQDDVDALVQAIGQVATIVYVEYELGVSGRFRFITEQYTGAGPGIFGDLGTATGDGYQVSCNSESFYIW